MTHTHDQTLSRVGSSVRNYCVFLSILLLSTKTWYFWMLARTELMGWPMEGNPLWAVFRAERRSQTQEHNNGNMSLPITTPPSFSLHHHLPLLPPLTILSPSSQHHLYHHNHCPLSPSSPLSSALSLPSSASPPSLPLSYHHDCYH